MIIRPTVFTIAIVAAATALAHAPVSRCELNDRTVSCEGRFQDDTKAEGVTMSVITYDGETLHTHVLDKTSRFQFELPSRPFYVLMDAGPGEMFEVDWRDIQGADKGLFETDRNPPRIILHKKT